jgi:hypothetical protein
MFCPKHIKEYGFFISFFLSFLLLYHLFCKVNKLELISSRNLFREVFLHKCYDFYMKRHLGKSLSCEKLNSERLSLAEDKEESVCPDLRSFQLLLRQLLKR